VVPEPGRSAEQFRLGEDYDLDLRAYELRRDGHVIKLERIPMDLLVLLIERRGELVSRDEIIEKIWGKDVFLDTDGSINSAIRKIRQAFKDHPEEPRFLQTVSGRGYRFIAPIVRIPVGEEVLPDHVVPAQPQETSVRTQANIAGPAARGRSWIGPVAALTLAFAAAAVVAGVGYFRHARANRLTAQDTIVLGDFANSTGDPIFDDTLKQALTVSLRQSPFLNVLSDGKVSKTLKLMTLSPATPLTPAVANEVCQRAGSKAYVSSAIGSLGSEYVVGLKAVNCHSGDTLAQEQVTAAKKEQVLFVLGGAATKLREELGESLTSIQKFDVPLTEATTSSLEALRSYTQGLKTWNTNGETEAIPYLKRALELDPKFASAYVSLGTVYDNLQEPGLAVESMAKAYELRERASERERFYILGHYYRNVTGECGKASTVYEQWKQEYPYDPTPRTNLGNIYMGFGKFEESLAQHRDALRVEPNGVLIYENLSLVYYYMNRLDDANEMVKAALARKMDDANLHLMPLQIAFLKGDSATIEKEMKWGMGKPGVEDGFLSTLADIEGSKGHIAKARELTRRAADSAVRSGSKETAAFWMGLGALRELEVGNTSEATKQANATLALAPNVNSQVVAAIIFARAGKDRRASEIAEQLNRHHPLNTLVQSYWLPSIRAVLQLNRHDAAGAVQTLQAAIPYELSSGQPVQGLYPIFERGRALLMLHRGSEAVVEFHKALDHGTLMTFTSLSLAHLQLARAFAESKETEKARNAYKEFFTLWQDADSENPIYVSAKADYSKLTSSP
jgi:DNA-binding winged helix-turn-helix (wHTH) protein/Tfp pilus assembly protein PilF